MIIIGNKYIKYPELCVIKSIKEIQTTDANSIVAFKFDKTMAKYCNDNDVKYAIFSDCIIDAVFANGLNASFIIVEHNGIQIQKLAENYMFDSKILQMIEDDNAIEQVALCGIDGVVYQSLLKDL
jgi:hypothetical protein